MFGELPQIIAEARHSDEMYRRDIYLSAIVWRDDGTEHGQFFKCTPPPELPADGITSLDGWEETPVTKEDEAEDLDAREWRSLRKRAENSDRLPDGSLLILAEKTQRGVIQQLSIMAESKWYTDRMREDARRSPDDQRRLCVVDGNLNGLTNTHGAALDRGWVHIDRLNQWGATLETVNVFYVDEVQQATQTERRPTVQEAIADYVAVVMRANPAYTAERLYGHMRREAGTEGSPFATLVNGGEMFCAEASAPCGQASVTAALTAYRKALKRR